MQSMNLQIPSVHIVKCDSWSILESMLNHTEQPCEVVICSFAIAEGWIKRLWKLKLKGKITHITVVLDRAVMIRHRSKLIMLENVIDKIYFTDSHAKLLAVKSSSFEAVSIMSANATMNYRIEAFYVTDTQQEIKSIREDLQRIYDNSRSINPGD